MYTQITDKAVLAVRSSNSVKAKVYDGLMQRFGFKTRDTARAWFEGKHYALTCPDAVRIIAEGTGLKPEQITEELYDEQPANS